MIKIGRRNLKTAIAIFICTMTFVILNIVSEDFTVGWYTPFFASLAAAYSVQVDKQTSVLHAKNRSIASLFGGIYGMLVVIVVNILFKDILEDNSFYVVKYTIISFMTVFLIIMTVKTNNQGATFVAILTYLNVTTNARVDIPIWQFATNRILCTIYGVNVALLVNTFKLPYRKKERLYIVSIDDATIYTNNVLKGFPLYKLNKMIYDKEDIVLYTQRTPDALKASISGLKINKPALVFNGAALYDFNKFTYLHKININTNTIIKLNDFFNNNNISYFTGVIKQDLLHIYKKEATNLAEEVYIKNKKNAPYCSFNFTKYEDLDDIVYFMILQKDEYIDEIHNLLEENSITNLITTYKYKYLGMEGYSLMKIYSKDVNKLECIDIVKNSYKLNDCLLVCGQKDKKLKNYNAPSITFNNELELDKVYKKMTRVNK